MALDKVKRELRKLAQDIDYWGFEGRHLRTFVLLQGDVVQELDRFTGVDAEIAIGIAKSMGRTILASLFALASGDVPVALDDAALLEASEIERSGLDRQ